MANCADCGRNPKRGCLPDCPRDKTVSVWARYRARKKAARDRLDQVTKAFGSPLLDARNAAWATVFKDGDDA